MIYYVQCMRLVSNFWLHFFFQLDANVNPYCPIANCPKTVPPCSSQSLFVSNLSKSPNCLSQCQNRRANCQNLLPVVKVICRARVIWLQESPGRAFYTLANFCVSLFEHLETSFIRIQSHFGTFCCVFLYEWEPKKPRLVKWLFKNRFCKSNLPFSNKTCYT